MSDPQGCLYYKRLDGTLVKIGGGGTATGAALTSRRRGGDDWQMPAGGALVPWNIELVPGSLTDFQWSADGTTLTVRRAGVYLIDVMLQGRNGPEGNTSDFIGFTLRANGEMVAEPIGHRSGFWEPLTATAVVHCEAGDVIDVLATGNVLWWIATVRSRIHVVRLSGAQGPKGDPGEPGEQGPPGEAVGLDAPWAMGKRTGFWDMPANQFGVIPWDARSTSSADDFEWVSDTECLVKRSGVYLTTLDLTVLGQPQPAPEYLFARLVAAGNVVAEIVNHQSGVWNESSTSAVVRLAAGDRVLVQCMYEGSVPLSIAGTPDTTRSQLQIVRLSGIKGDPGDPGGGAGVTEGVEPPPDLDPGTFFFDLDADDASTFDVWTRDEADERFGPRAGWFSQTAALASGESAANRVLAEVIIPPADRDRMVVATQRGILNVRHRIEFTNVTDGFPSANASFILESSASGGTRTGMLPANKEGRVRTVTHVAGTVNIFAGDINFFGLHVSAWG